MYLINYKHLLVNDWYVYPDWAYALGWTMTFSTIVVAVLFVVGQLCLTPGTFKQVSIQRKGTPRLVCQKVLIHPHLFTGFQRISILCRPAEHPAWSRGTAGGDETAAELTTSAVNS